MRVKSEIAKIVKTCTGGSFILRGFAGSGGEQQGVGAVFRSEKLELGVSVEFGYRERSIGGIRGAEFADDEFDGVVDSARPEMPDRREQNERGLDDNVAIVDSDGIGRIEDSTVSRVRCFDNGEQFVQLTNSRERLGSDYRPCPFLVSSSRYE